MARQPLDSLSSDLKNGEHYTIPNLRCTQKLLKAIGSRSVYPVEHSRSALLGDWYANLLVIARQNALLFTNEATLYSFAVLGVRKPGLASLSSIFVEHLRRNLAYEDMPPYVINTLIAEYRNLGIAETANRSVLGSMNDLADLLEHYVQDAGGSGAGDVRQINQQLNRSPHKPLGWKSAIDVLHERLLGAVAVPGRPRSRVFVN